MALSARGLIVRRASFRLAVEALTIEPGGLALLGRNGAGKSTLLLALQGLLPFAGSIERPARCAGVFAQPAVLHGTVRWNVAAVVRAALELDERAAGQRTDAVLASVGLNDAREFDARRLSSGQRQRLALARALALEPQALFLDEPFANIDADGRPLLRAAVRAFCERSGCTLVLATQNLADVTALCRTALVLENGSVAQLLAADAIGTSNGDYLRALGAESAAAHWAGSAPA
jgi:ABC-type multidrug transport system ATPase subunit